MKTLHCQKYLLLILLVLPMSLVRCKVSDTASFLPSATIEMVSSPESTPLLDKPAPVHAHEELTQMPLLTRTPGSYTPTPAPTLTTSEEQILLSSLFQNNAGCQLPCWWGFMPGETTWQTAQEFFALLGEYPDVYPSVLSKYE